MKESLVLRTPRTRQAWRSGQLVTAIPPLLQGPELASAWFGVCTGLVGCKVQLVTFHASDARGARATTTGSANHSIYCAHVLSATHFRRRCESCPPCKGRCPLRTRGPRTCNPRRRSCSQERCRLPGTPRWRARRGSSQGSRRRWSQHLHCIETEGRGGRMDGQSMM